MLKPPLRLLIGFSPGSASDIVARMLCQPLGARLGREVRVEPHPGADGKTAAMMLDSSAPDGETLLVATLGTHALAPALTGQSAGIARDVPVALVASAPLVVTAARALGVSTLEALVALARERPGAIDYASSAIGGAPHFACALFCTMAGVTMRHQPYAQTGVLYDDLAAGRVALTFNNIMSVLPLIEAGEVLGLAVTSAQRSPRAPGLPTVAECGFIGYEFVNWLGIVAPPGTPATTATALGDAIARTVDSSDVRALLVKQGMQPMPGTPAEFGVHIAAEVTRWSRVVAADRRAFGA